MVFLRCGQKALPPGGQKTSEITQVGRVGGAKQERPAGKAGAWGSKSGVSYGVSGSGGSWARQAGLVGWVGWAGWTGRQGVHAQLLGKRFGATPCLISLAYQQACFVKCRIEWLLLVFPVITLLGLGTPGGSKKIPPVGQKICFGR